MKINSLLIFLIAVFAVAGTAYDLNRLQGAWWSDPTSPTADFSIEGRRVWLDIDAQYHPCRVEGDILVFDLGELGVVKNRIIGLKGDQLVLEHIETGRRRTLTRAGRP